MADSNRRTYYVYPETHTQLQTIGVAHGADPRRSASAGLRVAAGYHQRMARMLREIVSQCDDLEFEAGRMDNVRRKAESLLDQLEGAK